MFEIDKNTNLLEREEFKYPLQNVKRPNLFRSLFNYDEIPKVAFNHRIVPISMPKDIWITDTTFRDGQQAREPYTVEQIVHLFSLLHKLSGPKGIIRQSEFFVYSKKDREALYKCMELGYEFPEVTSWIRANKDDFSLVKSIGIKETGILVSSSDYHIFYKMHSNRKQAIQHYISVIRECMETGIRPRCHFEDVTRADFYGFVVPFAMQLMNLMEEYKIPIKIRLCDTMGYAITYPGSVLPRCVQGLVYGLYHYAGVPHELLEWHGHNDFYKSVTNATYAWLYGASSVNCSLLGLGERTGNTPLEAMVIEYAQMRGSLDGMDTTVITDIADYYKNEIGFDIPPMMPFVGERFNMTSAGIHADGLMKNEEVYNIFNTEKILKRPCRVSIGSSSGLAGVTHWVNQRISLPQGKAFSKQHELIQRIKDWVDAQYAEGRVTIIGDDEMEQILQKHLQELNIEYEVK